MHFALRKEGRKRNIEKEDKDKNEGNEGGNK
jgi:hypothetical protein